MAKFVFPVTFPNIHTSRQNWLTL